MYSGKKNNVWTFYLKSRELFLGLLIFSDLFGIFRHVSKTNSNANYTHRKKLLFSPFHFFTKKRNYVICIYNTQLMYVTFLKNKVYRMEGKKHNEIRKLEFFLAGKYFSCSQNRMILVSSCHVTFSSIQLHYRFL